MRVRICSPLFFPILQADYAQPLAHLHMRALAGLARRAVVQNNFCGTACKTKV